jgi:hypothetical protein
MTKLFISTVIRNPMGEQKAVSPLMIKGFVPVRNKVSGASAGGSRL